MSKTLVYVINYLVYTINRCTSLIQKYINFCVLISIFFFFFVKKTLKLSTCKAFRKFLLRLS